jgi:hypothetical protein
MEDEGNVPKRSEAIRFMKVREVHGHKFARVFFKQVYILLVGFF